MNVNYTWGLNAWHHLAAVGNGTDLRVYVDGDLVGTGGNPTGNYGSSAYPFNIGGGGIWGSSGDWFNGWIDEVAFYDQALSAGELQQHYLLGLMRPQVEISASGDNIHLQLTGTPGQNHRVDYTPALPTPGPWPVLTNLQPLATSPFAISLPATNAIGFFRADVVP